MQNLISKIPNSNIQIPNNNQIPITKLQTVWDLKFVIWNLFGIWGLLFGILKFGI